MRKPFILYKRKAGKKKADCYYVGFLNKKTGTYKRVAATSLKTQIGDAAGHLSVSARVSVEEMARMAITLHIGTTP